MREALCPCCCNSADGPGYRGVRKGGGTQRGYSGRRQRQKKRKSGLRRVGCASKLSLRDSVLATSKALLIRVAELAALSYHHHPGLDLSRFVNYSIATNASVPLMNKYK